MGVHDTEKYSQIKALLDIPEAEPIFILRAQDILAMPTLKAYKEYSERSPNDPSWLQNLYDHMTEFEQWQHNNSDKVKFPD